jgi:CRISPR-associated protein Cmr6
VARIPISPDVAELIGAAAEKVENRSLLLDKFVFHKKWPCEVDPQGREVKWDEASRWSYMRIAEDAAQILNRDAAERRKKARGQDREPKNQERYLGEARLAESLANISWNDKEIAELRARHTQRFVAIFRAAFKERAAITIGQLEGRLAINLAESLIQNAGISLDRLFGLPFIPGSAVKGVSRHAALEELREAPAERKRALFDLFRSIFGTADTDFKNGDLRPYRSLLGALEENQKGAIAWLPAYPINRARIVVDLTNVHYPDYYKSGRIEDLAKERPKPNPFPAVEIGAQFAFCLVLNGINEDRALLTQAERWLNMALTVRGLGAKTACGYGWFSLKPEVLDNLEEEERKEAATAAQAEAKAKAATVQLKAEEARLQSLEPVQRESEALLKLADEAFAHFAKELASKPEAQQRAFIELLRTNPQKRDRLKTWKKKKPDLIKSIEAIRDALKLPPLP